MSVSAVSNVLQFESPDSLVPRLPSELATPSTPGSKHLHMFGADDDSPSFEDFLDVINPLQHIPIVNDIYRELTGDKIGVGARLAGGALFGGPIGLIGAALNATLEEATGKDAGGHLIALFKDDEAPSSGTALASAQAPNPGAEAIDSSKTPLSDQLSAAKPLMLPDMAGDDASLAAAAPPLPLAAPLAPVTPAAPVAQSVQATAKPEQVAALPVEAAEGKAMPLWGNRQPRLMPVPSRNTPVATQSPPAVGTAISQGGMRSNTPITGARPNRAPVTPAMVQEMAQAQSSANAANAASGDWFSGAMMQGLSKYERNAKIGQSSAASVSESQ
ncbi:hypothetical protein CU669_01205 [Paramagnetospirillum kuznetsovii]|uniref:Uncharacterized protein n=1 Tax=Paramagnetospirillum kuznetsovii TaxID=2053833 RepID=A0A364P386_9PROT|nr:hypothetical protein [Paramagnetospirillum kuznetsovii]RAU23746.1 hypothetical protein CU669_01205 [Paramagnetospirillum kuznetsovii]